jgi:hypothetical protein
VGATPNLLHLVFMADYLNISHLILYFLTWASFPYKVPFMTHTGLLVKEKKSTHVIATIDASS